MAIRANFALAPKDAVAYFRAKGAHLSWNWTDTETERHATSFTVAKVTSFDVLQAIHNEVDRAISQGRTFAQFKDALKPRLQELGWWGKKEVLDIDTGEITKAQLGSTRRLRTIFQANVQSAYMAGRYKRYRENVDHRPWWQYVAILDNRTREAHEALSGKVWHWDDPIWETIWPPNGFNCRCRVTALTNQELERKGITPLATRPDDFQTINWPVGRDGETMPRTGVRVGGRWFWPDVGWDRNPAIDAAEKTAEWLGKKAASYNAPVGAAFGAAFRGALLKRMQTALAPMVESVAATLQSKGDAALVHLIAPNVVTAMAEHGITLESARVLLTDAALLHAIREVKTFRGASLPLSTWRNLPALLADAEVYLDTRDTAMLFIFQTETTGGGLEKVVVSVNYTQKIREAGSTAKRQSIRANFVNTGGIIDVSNIGEIRYIRLR